MVLICEFAFSQIKNITTVLSKCPHSLSRYWRTTLLMTVSKPLSWVWLLSVFFFFSCSFLGEGRQGAFEMCPAGGEDVLPYRGHRRGLHHPLVLHGGPIRHPAAKGKLLLLSCFEKVRCFHENLPSVAKWQSSKWHHVEVYRWCFTICYIYLIRADNKMVQIR